MQASSITSIQWGCSTTSTAQKTGCTHWRGGWPPRACCIFFCMPMADAGRSAAPSGHWRYWGQEPGPRACGWGANCWAACRARTGSGDTTRNAGPSTPRRTPTSRTCTCTPRKPAMTWSGCSPSSPAADSSSPAFPTPRCGTRPGCCRGNCWSGRGPCPSASNGPWWKTSIPPSATSSSFSPRRPSARSPWQKPTTRRCWPAAASATAASGAGRAPACSDPISSPLT